MLSSQHELYKSYSVSAACAGVLSFLGIGGGAEQSSSRATSNGKCSSSSSSSSWRLRDPSKSAWIGVVFWKMVPLVLYTLVASFPLLIPGLVLFFPISIVILFSTDLLVKLMKHGRKARRRTSRGGYYVSPWMHVGMHCALWLMWSTLVVLLEAIVNFHGANMWGEALNFAIHDGNTKHFVLFHRDSWRTSFVFLCMLL